MLLREGVSKGNEPTVQVLEICHNRQRKEDDLLPYLSPFAKFFRPLPKKEKDMVLKTALIPLNDLECITRTIIDVPENVQNLNKKKRKKPNWVVNNVHANYLIEALELARDQFEPLCRSWNYEDWDEFDYGRIKNLNFREIDEQRRKEGQIATGRKCLTCPNFLKHVSTATYYLSSLIH